MGSVKDYFSSLGTGITSLLKGMGVTGKEFLTPKVTESYPDDRKTIQYAAPRFRAKLVLKYDAEGHHKCIACGICQRNCPNGTINLTTKMVDLPDGKKKRSSPTTSSRLYSPVRCSSRNLIICPNRPSRHRLPSPPRLLRLPLSLMSLKSKKKNQI